MIIQIEIQTLFFHGFSDTVSLGVDGRQFNWDPMLRKVRLTSTCEAAQDTSLMGARNPANFETGLRGGIASEVTVHEVGRIYQV